MQENHRCNFLALSNEFLQRSHIRKKIEKLKIARAYVDKWIKIENFIENLLEYRMSRHGNSIVDLTCFAYRFPFLIFLKNRTKIDISPNGIFEEKIEDKKSFFRIAHNWLFETFSNGKTLFLEISTKNLKLHNSKDRSIYDWSSVL